MSWWDDLMGGDIGSLFGDASGGLGSLLGNPQQGGLISLLQLLGMGSGAYSQQQQQNWLDKITGAQGQSLKTAQNPAAMNALIQKYFQGFTPTQNRAILGPVEQAAAARGQNQSPATMQILSEQALAPYANQQYQTAANLAENSLMMPFHAQPYNYPSFNPVGDMGGRGGMGASGLSGGDGGLAALLEGSGAFGSPQSAVSSYAGSFPESLGIPDPASMGISSAGWGW